MEACKTKHKTTDDDREDIIASVIDLDIGKITKSANSRGKTIFKCAVKCLFCDTRLSCQYSTHWQISNYEAHLKKPHSNDTFDDQSDDTNAIRSTPKKDLANDTSASKIEKNLGKKNRISIDANTQSKIHNILNLEVLNTKVYFVILDHSSTIILLHASRHALIIYPE